MKQAAGLRSGPAAFCANRLAASRHAEIQQFFIRDVEPSAVVPRLTHQERLQGRIMAADRTGLGFLGLIFGGVTAAVMLVACTVVIGHIDGRLQLESQTANVASSIVVR